MSFSPITSQIWVGPELNNPVDPPEDPKDTTIVVELMKKMQMTPGQTPDPWRGIINCRIEFRKEDDLLKRAGFPTDADHYLFDGIKDWTPLVPEGEQQIPDSFFQKGLNFWMPKRLTDSKAVVYVHCTQGINRSVTLAYAFLRAEGMSKEDALLRLNLQRIVTVWNDFFDRPWRHQAEAAVIEWQANQVRGRL